MKKLLGLVVLFLSGSVFAEEAAPAASSPLAPLESLVGGVWVATVPMPKDQVPLQIETRYVWADNHQAIRFGSTFLRGGKRLPYTDGFYAWNAEKRKIAIFYTDSGGGLVEGLITPEGEVLLNELVSTTADGGKLQIQARVTKDGPDAYTNAIFMQKDGGWAPFVTVRYERRK